MKRVPGGLVGGLLLLPPWADVSHLPMLGHVAEVHLEAGSRGMGRCPPEAVVTLTTLGDPLVPRPEAYLLSSHGPAGGTLSMTLSPLRSCPGGYQVSMFDLDLSYETNREGSGTALQVGVLKVGFSF
ncbi:hypothetical protein [Archangium lipolyticum]|uniref:hypothetical protein n=1 Tax=Archangium lipolyticum TaxID=2970465 RepID=UPI002149E48A|nr:hypothetical protein [Archangium lipolyticum]